MISDVLHEAVFELDHYLTDPFYDDFYKGKLREQIIKLRDEALYIAWVLNTPPSGRVPAKAAALRAVAEWRQKQDAEARRQVSENEQSEENSPKP